MDVVPGAKVEETTASKLTNSGVQAFQKVLGKVMNAGGGTIFMDEAYHLLHAVGGFVPRRRMLEAPMEMTSSEACLDALALLAGLVCTAKIRSRLDFTNVTMADEPLVSLTIALNVVKGMLQLLS